MDASGGWCGAGAVELFSPPLPAPPTPLSRLRPPAEWVSASVAPPPPRRTAATATPRPRIRHPKAGPRAAGARASAFLTPRLSQWARNGAVRLSKRTTAGHVLTLRRRFVEEREGSPPGSPSASSPAMTPQRTQIIEAPAEVPHERRFIVPQEEVEEAGFAVPSMPVHFARDRHERLHYSRVVRKFVHKRSDSDSDETIDVSELTGEVPVPISPASFRRRIWNAPEAPVRLFLSNWPRPYRAEGAGLVIAGLHSPTDAASIRAVAETVPGDLELQKKRKLYEMPEKGSAEELDAIVAAIRRAGVPIPSTVSDPVSGELMLEPVRLGVQCTSFEPVVNRSTLDVATELCELPPGARVFPDNWDKARGDTLVECAVAARALCVADVCTEDQEALRRVKDWVSWQRKVLEAENEGRNEIAAIIMEFMDAATEATLKDDSRKATRQQLRGLRRLAAAAAAMREEAYWRKRIAETSAVALAAVTERKELAGKARALKAKEKRHERGGLSRPMAHVQLKRFREKWTVQDGLARRNRTAALALMGLHAKWAGELEHRVVELQDLMSPVGNPYLEFPERLAVKCVFDPWELEVTEENARSVLDRALPYITHIPAEDDPWDETASTANAKKVISMFRSVL
eukprot:TRINITY_DN23869_c0_g1_i1.p1 TRINITY_DN23869_c0_g1~~TRINITY_DN23869_c0_g1_i1.p1  ORF type:complete len:631 (+),score=100.67 TRINITY_DN23869_c0_g1_i1:46-1938(+)